MVTERLPLKTLKDWYETIKEDVPHPFRKPLAYLFISIILSLLVRISKLPNFISNSALYFIWVIFIGLIVFEIRNLIFRYRKCKKRKVRSRELTEHINTALNTHHKNKSEIGKYFGFDKVKVILAPEEKKQSIKFFLDKIKTKNIEVFQVPLVDKENESVNKFNSWMNITMEQYLIGIHDYLTLKLLIMFKINKFKKFLDGNNSVQQKLFLDLQKNLIPQSNITDEDISRMETLEKEGLLGPFFIDTLYWMKSKKHSPYKAKSEVEHTFDWLTSYNEGPEWDLRLTTSSQTKIFPNTRFAYMLKIHPVDWHEKKAHEHFNSGGNLMVASIFTDDSLNEQHLKLFVDNLNKHEHTAVKSIEGLKYDRNKLLRNVKHTILRHKDFDYSLD